MPARSQATTRPPITPSRFQKDWGEARLVRLGQRHAPSECHPGAKQFLVRAGLPQIAAFWGLSTPFQFSYRRLQKPLRTLLREPGLYLGEPPPEGFPPEWSSLLLIGDERFCNGSALHCLEPATGRVLRFDVEVDEQPEPISASVAFHAWILLRIRRWSEQASAEPGPFRSSLRALRRELGAAGSRRERIDNSFWQTLLEMAEELGPGRFALRPDPLPRRLIG